MFVPWLALDLIIDLVCEVFTELGSVPSGVPPHRMTCCLLLRPKVALL